jgi:ankyrin repeat domain-containing protein 50
VLEIFDTLINQGANVNKVGGKFGSALQAAASKSHSRAIERLLSKGVDVNVSRGVYGSALQAAASQEYHMKYYPYTAKEFWNYDTVDLLLKVGADVNAIGGRHGSALRAATLFGNTEVVRLLLENRADPNMIADSIVLLLRLLQG